MAASCLRCKDVIPAWEKVNIHIDFCEKKERFHETLFLLEEEGVESLSIEQIKNMFVFLFDSGLSSELVCRLLTKSWDENVS